MTLELTPARPDDVDALTTLRAAAMRPSLEAVGRYDPQRARDRFSDSFVPERTHVIRQNGALAGFFVLHSHADHLYLDHLCLDQAFQGQGIGGQVMVHIQDVARKARLPLRLIALIHSPSNAFYLSHGFVHTGTEDVDNAYEWHPD